MPESEPQGCLAAVLRLLGIRPGGSVSNEERPPYQLREDFLSVAEFSFYRVLSSAIDSRAVICPKVNLADVFTVPKHVANQGYRNRISQKHVDFLICNPTSMKPIVGIELDDSSHARSQRKVRDQLVERVFSAAELPLLRVPVQAGYVIGDLKVLVEPHLKLDAIERQIPPAAAQSSPPQCPRCNVRMIERVAQTGRNAGRPFFGCPNFPRCREVVSVRD